MGTPSSNIPPSLLLQIRESVSTLNAALTQWHQSESASGSSPHSQASTSGARAATPRPLPPPAARSQVGVGVTVTSMAGGRRGRGQGLPSTYSSPTPRSSAGQTQHQLHGTPNSAREFRTLFGLSGRGRRNARSTSTAGAVGTFFKDVILLDYGQDTCKNKVPLFEAGRVSSSVMFQKAMDEEAIETVIEGLFEDLRTIPRPRFEYVKVLCHKVLVPQTSRTHTWNGAAIKHHTGQGDLYVRATAPLPDLDVGELSEDDFPVVFQPTSSSTSASTSASTSSSHLLPLPSTSSSSTPSTSTASPSRTTLRDSTVFSRTYTEYVDLLDYGEVEVETEGNGIPGIVTHHVPVRLEDSVMLDCLDSWRTAQVDEDAPHFRLSVRRHTLLRNIVNAYKKKEVDPRAPLVVYFVGEAGVDTGGLTRELATLCLPLIRESQYLAGPPGKMVPSQATHGIISGEIQAVGKMLGAVLLHSRLRLPFLNPMLAELLIRDDSPSVIGLIPDDGKRESVQKVYHASTEEDLTAALDGCTIVDDLGWSKIINIQNKDEVVRAATSHYSYYANKAAIDEFLLGLEFYGAKEFARKNPDCFRSMFGKLEQRLDANMVFDLFKPVYSPDGSNAKNMEEETMMYFIEFLQKCGTGDADVSGMTLEELLMFFSGAKDVPLGGFEIQPKLLFTSEMLPHASTCALELTLPMKYGNEKDFINMLVDAIRNTHGFGTV